MERTFYLQQLDRLRAQIRRDIDVPPSLLAEQLARAHAIISSLAAGEEMNSQMAPVVGTLRQAVSDFYSTRTHRGWAQQFALQDIDKLEKLAPPENPPHVP